jgi:hypothetical protein
MTTWLIKEKISGHVTLLDRKDSGEERHRDSTVIPVSIPVIITGIQTIETTRETETKTFNVAETVTEMWGRDRYIDRDMQYTLTHRPNKTHWTEQGGNSLVVQVLIGVCHRQTYVRVSRMSKDIEGLGVDGTWKSVLLSPNRGCENTFCCLTPGLVDVLHVLLPLLPSFTQHLSSEGLVQKMKCSSCFFPFSYNWAKKSK